MKLPIANNATIFRQLAQLGRYFKRDITIVLVIQLCVALASVVTPWIIGRSFDAINEPDPARAIRFNIIVLVCAVAIQSVLAGFGEYLSRALGQRFFHRLRIDLVDTVTHLPISTVEAAGTGDLLGRTTSDVDRIEYIVRVGISRITLLVLQILVTVVAALVIDWRVGFVVALSFVPVFFIVRKYLRRTIAAYLASSALNAEMSGDVTETVEHSATVDALHMGAYRTARTTVLLEEKWTNERYAALMRAFFSFGMVVALFSPVIIAVVWGSWLIGQGIVTVGAVISVLYAQQLRYQSTNYPGGLTKYSSPRCPSHVFSASAKLNPTGSPAKTSPLVRPSKFAMCHSRIVTVSRCCTTSISMWYQVNGSRSPTVGSRKIYPWSPDCRY